jgi:hypothetical protein
LSTANENAQLPRHFLLFSLNGDLVQKHLQKCQTKSNSWPRELATFYKTTVTFFVFALSQQEQKSCALVHPIYVVQHSKEIGVHKILSAFWREGEVDDCILWLSFAQLKRHF